MSHRIAALLLSLSLVLASIGSTHTKLAAAPAAATEPAFSSVMFIENVGQFAEGARFQVWGGPAGTMWLAEDAIWITVAERPSSPQPPSPNLGERGAVLPSPQMGRGAGGDGRGTNIRLSFVNANPHPRIETFDRLDTVVSYFIGNEPEKWRPDVLVWGGVRYVDLYPGVNLEITSEGGRMVQRLAARPDADLAAVRLRVEGADVVTVDRDTLRLTMAAGEAILPLLQIKDFNGNVVVQPYDAQMFDVAAPFVSARIPRPSSVAASQSPADNSSDLLYSTFLGGGNYDSGAAIVLDNSGRAYVTGDTYSSNFPTTPGAFDTSWNGADAFVVRLNAAGSALEYATFLGGGYSNGGPPDDFGRSITIDAAGRAYVTGVTLSPAFPTTPGAFDRSFGNGQCGWWHWCDESDAFVARLSASGNALEYATFLGGASDDMGYGIAVDGMGRAYVTGATTSSDFPATPGAFDTSHNGGILNFAAFVVRLNAAGSALEYATFLGGGPNDVGHGIAVDNAARAHVTGNTYSSNHPTTPDAFDVTARYKMLKRARVKMLTLVKWSHFRQNGVVSQTAVEETTYAESGAAFHDQDPIPAWPVH